jgi:hypothetical protein
MLNKALKSPGSLLRRDVMSGSAYKRRDRAVRSIYFLLITAIVFTGGSWNVFGNVAASTLIISEFRLNGPGGETDEYVELYNNTDGDILVIDSNPESCATQILLTGPIIQCGWAVVDLQGSLSNIPRFIIPIGTTIPARGHYLAASTGYSLSSVAAPDQTYNPPQYSGGEADFTGLALFNTADRSKFNDPLNVMDAVGFDGVATPFREGTGLSPATGITANAEYCFTRYQGGALPKDTNNNAQDFVLVATDPGLITQASAILGAPGPENRTSPVQRTNWFTVSVPSGVSSSLRTASPAVTNGDLGTLSLRRRFTNQTSNQVTKLRFRVTDMTTINSPMIYATQADVRVLNATLVGLSGTTLKATTLEPPEQPKGGGVNSSLLVNGSLTLPEPLAQGASIDVEFLLGVMRSGSYRFIISIEVLQ